MTHDDISDAEIEAVANAIDPTGASFKAPTLARARAAILASRAACLAEGKKMTAREPTAEMLSPSPSGLAIRWAADWRAMWDKAP